MPNSNCCYLAFCFVIIVLNTFKNVEVVMKKIKLVYLFLICSLFTYGSDFIYLDSLINSVVKGDLKSVKELLKKNISNMGKNIALMHAVKSNNQPLAELLIEEGADVNTQEEYGNTLLMEAIINNNESMAKMLEEKGADINTRTIFGDTALLYAINNDNRNIEEWLLSLGADY